VFAAWADPAAKPRWFGGPDDWGERAHAGLSRGGTEWNARRRRTARVDLHCAIHDIVPDRRIVYSYVMECGDAVASVTLATVEFDRPRPERGSCSPSKSHSSTASTAPTCAKGAPEACSTASTKMLQGKR